MTLMYCDLVRVSESRDGQPSLSLSLTLQAEEEGLVFYGFFLQYCFLVTALW